MRVVALAGPADFSGWREAARALLAQNVEPESVEWRVGGERDLFGEDAGRSAQPPGARAGAEPVFRVPRAFVELAELVASHKDDGRFALLYRLLWRLREDHDLLSRTTDDDVFRARAMAKTIRRERHKMEAFVRFREIDRTRRARCSSRGSSPSITSSN